MQLRTEIEITATPKQVWSVLTDTPAYSRWNPFIVEVGSHFSDGAQVSITVSPPGSSEMNFRAQIIQFRALRELRWESCLFFNFLFRGEHFFKLFEISPGVTRIVHGEDFSGLLVKFFHRQLSATARGFVLMNQALKIQVESQLSEGHQA